MQIIISMITSVEWKLSKRGKKPTWPLILKLARPPSCQLHTKVHTLIQQRKLQILKQKYPKVWSNSSIVCNTGQDILTITPYIRYIITQHFSYNCKIGAFVFKYTQIRKVIKINIHASYFENWTSSRSKYHQQHKYIQENEWYTSRKIQRNVYIWVQYKIIASLRWERWRMWERWRIWLG